MRTREKSLLLLLAAFCLLHRADGQVHLAGADRAALLGTVAAGLGHAIAEGEPIKCGTPLIMSARAARSSLPLSAQAALEALDARPSGPDTNQTSIVGNGFCIHFDTTGGNAAALLDAQHQPIAGSARAFADSVVSIMGTVVAEEIGVLGFEPPPTDGTLGGGPEYDIYVTNLGSEYGETAADLFTGNGSRSTTFITIDNDFTFVVPDSNKGLPALRVTLAHEFHHAIQIGSYGYWADDVWFHEITSVWMEDVVFTGVNDYYNYLWASWSQFFNPETPLNSNDLIMYSRGIWGQFMTKKYGADAMRHAWEAARTVAPLQALDQSLRTNSSVTLPQAFAEWCSWNAYTWKRADADRYYPEGAAYPPMAEIHYDIPGGLREVDGTLPCLASKYYRLSSGVDTVAIIAVHSTMDCGTSQSPFTFFVSTSKWDDSYKPTQGGLFLKTSFPSGSDWVVWEEGSQGTVSASIAAEGTVFPNPLRVDGLSSAYIRADAQEAIVSIYSSNMTLVYQRDQTAQTMLGRTVFTWTGCTTGGERVASGIYIFVLNASGRTIRGKLAVVRK